MTKPPVATSVSPETSTRIGQDARVGLDFPLEAGRQDLVLMAGELEEAGPPDVDRDRAARRIHRVCRSPTAALRPRRARMKADPRTADASPTFTGNTVPCRAFVKPYPG